MTTPPESQLKSLLKNPECLRNQPQTFFDKHHKKINKDLKKHVLGRGEMEFDYKSLEEKTQENLDRMREHFENEKIHIKRMPKISFDLKCQGLVKYKTPMTMRLDKGTVAAATLPLDHKSMDEMMQVLKAKLEKMEPAFTRIATIGTGIGHLARAQAKHFSITPPPGTQVMVIDSLSDLKMAEQALRLMGQAGIRGMEAGKNMREALLALSECGAGKKKKRKDFINRDEGVLYSREQSQRWANSYSHKRPKKL